MFDCFSFRLKIGWSSKVKFALIILLYFIENISTDITLDLLQKLHNYTLHIADKLHFKASLKNEENHKSQVLKKLEILNSANS